MLRSFLENKVWSKTPLASANREPADGLALVRDESVWVGHVLQGAGGNKLTMGAQQVGPAPGHLEVPPASFWCPQAPCALCRGAQPVTPMLGEH